MEPGKSCPRFRGHIISSAWEKHAIVFKDSKQNTTGNVHLDGFIAIPREPTNFTQACRPLYVFYLSFPPKIEPPMPRKDRSKAYSYPSFLTMLYGIHLGSIDESWTSRAVPCCHYFVRPISNPPQAWEKGSNLCLWLESNTIKKYTRCLWGS